MSLKKAKGLIQKHLRSIFSVCVVVALVVSVLESVLPFDIPAQYYFMIILVLLLALIDQVINLKKTQSQLMVFPTQVKATHEILSYINANSKKINRVDILAASSSSYNQILEALLEVDCKIRILLCDPKRVEACDEQNLIMATLNIQSSYFEEKRNKIKFGFYDAPPSFRGINIDDKWVGISWYTYLKDNNLKNSKINKIMGFTNPFIFLNSLSEDGTIMLSFFKKEFTRLWKKKIDPKIIEESWAKSKSIQKNQE